MPALPDLSRFAPPPFRPHPLLANQHAQTIWTTFLPRDMRGEAAWRAAERPWRLTLPDGDVLTGRLHVHADDPARRRPTLVLMHGLEGDADSHYMRGLACKAHTLGWHALRLNYRGCGEGAGLARRPYHGMATADIDAVLRALAAESEGPLALAGVSLGANKLLRLVAEYGATPPVPLGAAVAISPPIDYVAGNEVLSRGVNLMYNRYFLQRARRKLRRLAELHQDDPKTLEILRRARRAQLLMEFDAEFTAPMGGFRDLTDYYQRAGAKAVLGDIALPTLIVHAADDPIIPMTMFREAEPTIRANPWLTTIYTEAGGHVGFLELSGRGPEPWMDAYWAENVALSYLREVLERQGVP